MKTTDMFDYDSKFLPKIIAGVDEVGRGPLAGPVVCAACIMPLNRDKFIDKINDSKKLSEKLREELYNKIIETAVDFHIAEVGNAVIDKINILNATKLCMKIAVEGLQKIRPSLVLVDAVTKLDISYPYESIIKGDEQSYNIAAASILAKVYRDRLMARLSEKYEGYNFISNKGYGTAEHITALKTLGKTDIHRETFIKNFV